LRKRYLVTGIPNMWEVSMGGCHIGISPSIFNMFARLRLVVSISSEEETPGIHWISWVGPRGCLEATKINSYAI
jgi:hypothetical protein